MQKYIQQQILAVYKFILPKKKKNPIYFSTTVTCSGYLSNTHIIETVLSNRLLVYEHINQLFNHRMIGIARQEVLDYQATYSKSAQFVGL